MPQATQPSHSRKSANSSPQRLQKILAAAGIGSRRHCEDLILAGRVEVDRQIVTQLGTRANVQNQEIRVDGELIRPAKLVYFVVHKPPGVVSTNRDPDGRPRVVDLVAVHERLFTVGRLDKGSSGLILVTNDGALANRLAHPRYRIEKTYLVTVNGRPSPATLLALRKGVHLAEGRANLTSVRIKKTRTRNTVLEIILSEGKNREIRRMLARFGHKTQELKRIAMGPLRLSDLPIGTYRPLSVYETRALRQVTRGQPRSNSKRQHRPKSLQPAKKKTPKQIGRVIGADGAKTPNTRRNAVRSVRSTGRH